MQLDVGRTDPTVRRRLGAAVCLLLAASAPALARAESNGEATWRFDGSALLYGERQRTTVIEPVARITRLFANGQTLSAQLGIDAMTGASPTGAVPSGAVHTTTSASGHVSSSRADQPPTNTFRDLRGLFDLQWQAPIGSHLGIGVGGHVSRERDYRSLGRNGSLSLDLWQHLTTITAGAGVNDDRVFPVSGIPEGLGDGTGPLLASSLPKRVESRLFGISQILSRRWMLALNTTRTTERGYLTEPYKVISLVSTATGLPEGEITERRPDARDRTDVLANSVYHLTDDVLYLSYRRYWDTWGVSSNTYDVKVHHDLGRQRWILPHLRFYSQSAADFFVHELTSGAPRPEFATSDGRLGPLKTVTAGLTYGFPVIQYGGELRLRGELIHQWGDNHPSDAIATQRNLDLSPPLDVGALTVSYSVDF